MYVNTFFLNLLIHKYISNIHINVTNGQNLKKNVLQIMLGMSEINQIYACDLYYWQLLKRWFYLWIASLTLERKLLPLLWKNVYNHCISKPLSESNSNWIQFIRMVLWDYFFTIWTYRMLSFIRRELHSTMIFNTPCLSSGYCFYYATNLKSPLRKKT